MRLLHYVVRKRDSLPQLKVLMSVAGAAGISDVVVFSDD
jgi:hypothetical protein